MDTLKETAVYWIRESIHYAEQNDVAVKAAIFVVVATLLLYW